jgi:IPT/TIG domain
VADKPSRLRRTAVVAFDGALVIGTGAVAGLFATGGSAVASTPGPQWTPQTASLPTSPNAPEADPGARIVDLSCLSSSYCVGVGQYTDTGDDSESVFETYSGGTWSAVEAPAPSTDAKFESVSCWEVGSCVAVGDYKNGEFSTLPVIDVLSGGTWTSIDVPLPSDALPTGEEVLDSLSSVSCQSDGSCVAVGSYKNSTGFIGLIETFAGGLWTASAAPAPSDADADADAGLSQVSCPSAESCVAVGTYDNSSGDNVGQLLVDSGGTWTPESAPLPANASGGTSADVESVSCAGATCEAGGDYEDSGGQEHGLLEHLSGGSWTPTETPEPADAGSGSDQNAGVDAIACSAGDSCVAVGSYENSGGDTVGMIESVQGGTPTVTRTPLPSDADPSNTSDLSAVSCSASDTCVTVGEYLPTGGTEAALIDTEAAGSWGAQAAPLPADTLTGASADSALLALSCSPDGSCAAGGDYLDGSSDEQGLLENFAPAAPTVTSLVPAAGPAAGGVPVTITGTGFFPGATVDFGSTVSPSFTYVSPTELTAVTPAEATGPTGSLTVDVTVTTAGGTSATTAGDHYTFLASSGYWEVARDGGVFTFGTAAFYGSMGGQHLNAPIVGIATTPDRKGYWEVAADGGVFSFGDARFWGSTGSLHLNAPIVGIAPTPSGNGYWLVAADGGVFNYGDAAFWGSAGSLHLNKPVVGMAASHDGNGYWLVASDGGIFNYGDAGFLGSAGSIALNKPVVGMAPTTDGNGYWLVASDGGIFNYDAAFLGSAGSTALNWPVEGMAAVTASPGYWLVAADGGVFSYGGAQFEGSMGGKPLVQPVVGIAEG